MLYFTQPREGGPIKIGHSSYVADRLRKLRHYYGRDLIILKTMPGGRAEETAMHERFAHLRFPRTELFRPDPELVDFIGAGIAEKVPMDVMRPADRPYPEASLGTPYLKIAKVHRPDEPGLVDCSRLRASNAADELRCYDALAEAIEAARDGNEELAWDCMKLAQAYATDLVNSWAFDRIYGAVAMDLVSEKTERRTERRAKS